LKVRAAARSLPVLVEESNSPCFDNVAEIASDALQDKRELLEYAPVWTTMSPGPTCCLHVGAGGAGKKHEVSLA